jgi:CRISPR system Cascade subunit CasC
MNFVNFHVLISHSPSCLNRDDMNMQKTAVFGGMRRVRISSQSLKRAMRFSAYYQQHFGRSIRTRDLERVTEELLKALGARFDTDTIRLAAAKFVKSDATTVGDTDEDPEEGAPAQEKGLAVAPWVVDEIAVICEAIQEAHRLGLTEEERDKALRKEGKSVGKGKDKRTQTREECLSIALDEKISKLVEGRIEALRGAMGRALDVVLSGRMATAGLMTPVDGALAVAHAITTHTVEGDVDWFTAVDDLVQLAGETGAGHLNTQEFSAGVFYRYASLNLKQLQVNLGLLPDMKAEETSEARARALDIARHVLHMLATVVPSAKQQSFAAHNLAEFALVSLCSQPISLANAFERPVKADREGGYLANSIKHLCDYWQRLHEAYGFNGRAAAFAVGEGGSVDGALILNERLADLEAWLAADGR